MPITTPIAIKAAGSALTRTIGFPVDESFNVTDVSTLRLRDGATILPASFTVTARWKAPRTTLTAPIKWATVTFKDTASPRNLTIVDSGGTVPAQTNPIAVTNNTNDIVVSNGLISATINKVTDGQDLITSFLTGTTERLASGSKPRLTIPVTNKTQTTWRSANPDGSFGFAVYPPQNIVKVLDSSIFAVNDTIDFFWEGELFGNVYFPTGGNGNPYLFVRSGVGIPPISLGITTNVHQPSIILNPGPSQDVIPILWTTSDGIVLSRPPAITPTAGMKVRFQGVDAEPNKTITAINPTTNELTLNANITNWIPQGIEILPAVVTTGVATLSLKAGSTIIERQYGDKAVIVKQEGVFKNSGGARIQSTLDFVIRHYIYADTGFIRTRLTMRNIHTDATLPECSDIFLDGLKFTLPTNANATAQSDAVTAEAASVTRYKANNLHSSLNHSGIANFQFGVHDFAPSYPNGIGIDANGLCTFDIFPEASGPIKVNGSLIKSRDLFWGLNASSGFALLDNLGATFDPAYIANSKAVRPNMVEKRDWNTEFASEPQKFRDACIRAERQFAMIYDVTQAEESFSTRPAMSLYEYRWDYCERRPSPFPFGWNKWGNTPDDVGFGNNRFDLPFWSLFEGLREPTLAKAELAFRLGFQQIRNRMELGQYWSNRNFNNVVGLDLKGLARYERASGEDPFNYTNQLAPTHSWNEGTCLYWALTDDPIAEEAALAGANQAAQYNYQGTANALLFGTGIPNMGSDGNNGNGAEPRYVGWPIHNLVTGYRYFGNPVLLQRAQEYSQSFIATAALEPQDDGFINFRSGTSLAPMFQHAGYCMLGIIEAWRDTPAGTLKTALGNYIVKVAKWLQRGDQRSSVVTADAPLLTGGKAHPSDANRYNPASHMPFSYARSYGDTLSAGINATATTIPLTGSASTFDLSNNVKRGVLVPAGQLSNPANWEYFTYTGASGNSLTGVVRGFDGTTARAFAAGDIVYPTGFNSTESDLIVATLIMGARISGDATLQDFAQTVWEDSVLYRYRIDGGNPQHVTVGNYHPINTWPLNVSTNGLKTSAQGAQALREFLGDRVNPPALPTISGLSPNSATAGGAQFTITVNGANFESDAEVRWNATTLTRLTQSPTQLTATVPASLIAAAGTATITVRNVTQNLTSGGVTFTINPAAPSAPTITSRTPTTAVTNVATGPITITGTNLTGATVTINGTSVTPTSVTATQIVLPSQTFTSAGVRTIAVTTGGGTVNTTITVNAPAPPPTPTTGGITLTGATNVLIGSWAGQPAVINTAPTGGANSTEQIPAGRTGYVQVSLLTQKQDTHFGLSEGLSGTNPAAIDLAIHFRDDYTLAVKEDGVIVYETGAAPNEIQTWEIGDQFQIYVERDRILLMRGWKTFHIVPRPTGVTYRFACTTAGLTTALGNPLLKVEGAQ